MSTAPAPSEYDDAQQQLPFITDEERVMLTSALCWYATQHAESLALIYGFASRHGLTSACSYIDHALSKSVLGDANGKGVKP